MKLSSFISAFALVSAMTLSGAATAQSMIGGVEVPAEQLQQFQEKCATLNSTTPSAAAAPAKSLSEPNSESDDATATGSVVANGEDDPADSKDSIDTALAGLTADQCKEAGL